MSIQNKTPTEALEDLSSDEIAILELTGTGEDHPHDVEKYSLNPVILTTKDAYSWAGILCLALQRNSSMEESEMREAVIGAVSDCREELRAHYALQSWAAPPPYPAEAMKRAMLRRLGFDEDSLNEVYRRVDAAYTSLMRKGFIVDPIAALIGGVAVVVLGVIPHGFTSTTNKGRTVYRKIEALFWSYTRESSKGTEKRTIEFKTWKILKIFKTHLVSCIKEVVDDITPKNA